MVKKLVWNLGEFNSLWESLNFWLWAKPGVPNQLWALSYFGIYKIMMPHSNIQFLHIQNFTAIHVKED